ncbi:transcriptional regulator [Streptomyces rubiginosohelvolus]|uniref:transcriptional regulator n=1 Tax=Streptomyces rubiginosohelvolus TaxID=67362 RepID=UPI00364CB8E3
MDLELWLGLAGVALTGAGLYYARRAVGPASEGESRRSFVNERKDMRARYVELSELAADIHLRARCGLERIGDSTLLWEPAMRPPRPVPLRDVTLTWRENPPPADPALLRAARRYLPKETRSGSYERYSSAMGDLARPALYEDNPCFRLVRADWSYPDGPQLGFGMSHYFELIDQNEAVAHELAATTRREPERLPHWRHLPLRNLLTENPLRLETRTVLPSVGTLTLRRTPDGRATFFLLKRGGGKVATVGDTYGPLPGGMIQPASQSPGAYRRDLSLWRVIMREYNEELLGAPEAKGESGTEVDYTRPPYSLLDAALSDGSLRVWCFGMALEPLHLAVCVLTVAVFEAETFDTIFADAVEENEEGQVISGNRSHGRIVGLSFTESEIAALGTRKLSSPAAGLLQLAQQYREMLLAPPGITSS